jgi:hypothetical protein
MRSLLALLTLAACAHPPVGELRFRNQAPVWHVNDRAPLPKTPEERPYYRGLYHADGFVVRRMTRAMDKIPDRRAADTNSLEEVPSSTWFTNRIGVRDLSPDEIRNGPNRQPGPFENRPWTITKEKSGGTAIGFVFKDKTGASYLLKFDSRGRPEMETAAHAIVHRALWALGYNVPEDYIGYIKREDLQISPKATREAAGKKLPLTEHDLHTALDLIDHTADGRIRVLASRYLPGKPIGPYAREGTRGDDPNDKIPHELRRSLRGQFPIFAWLNHTDLQEDNTLDTFEDGHVVHYLVDFGNALGVMGYGLKWQTVGYTYRFDWGMALKSLFSLGLWQRPWEEIGNPKLRGVGLFEAEHFEPGDWRPNSFYWPLEDKDRFDAFWGAKLMMRFTREQLKMIVGEAKLSDPRSAAYMLDTLVARQRKTGLYWFERVAPLDRFARVPTKDGDLLCFTDLLLSYKLDNPQTRYELATFDRDGRQTSRTRQIASSDDGQVCVGNITPSKAPDGYTIVRLRVHRNDSVMPDVRVHLAYRPDRTFDVIGLRRE